MWVYGLGQVWDEFEIRIEPGFFLEPLLLIIILKDLLDGRRIKGRVWLEEEH